MRLKLLSKETKSSNSKILDLSIGQPYTKFPLFVKSVLAEKILSGASTHL